MRDKNIQKMINVSNMILGLLDSSSIILFWDKYVLILMSKEDHSIYYWEYNMYFIHPILRE